MHQVSRAAIRTSGWGCPSMPSPFAGRSTASTWCCWSAARSSRKSGTRQARHYQRAPAIHVESSPERLAHNLAVASGWWGTRERPWPRWGRRWSAAPAPRSARPRRGATTSCARSRRRTPTPARAGRQALGAIADRGAAVHGRAGGGVAARRHRGRRVDHRRARPGPDRPVRARRRLRRRAWRRHRPGAAGRAGGEAGPSRSSCRGAVGRRLGDVQHPGAVDGRASRPGDRLRDPQQPRVPDPQAQHGHLPAALRGQAGPRLSEHGPGLARPRLRRPGEGDGRGGCAGDRARRAAPALEKALGARRPFLLDVAIEGRP